MNLNSFKNYSKEKAVSLALIVFSILLGALLCARVASFFVGPARASNSLQEAIAQTERDPNDLKEYMAQSKALADELKKKNLFVVPPPKQHPVKEVTAILGDQVWIAGKWYGVGGKIGDAKIVAIEATQVKVEWDGKIKAFAPMGARSAPPAPPKGDVKKPAAAQKGAKKAPAQAPESEPAQPVAAAAEEDPLAWMGVTLSPRAREKLLEQWNKMSDEEKEKAKEEWNSLPDDRKQQIADQMDQNL